MGASKWGLAIRERLQASSGVGNIRHPGALVKSAQRPRPVRSERKSRRLTRQEVPLTGTERRPRRQRVRPLNLRGRISSHTSWVSAGCFRRMGDEATHRLSYRPTGGHGQTFARRRPTSSQGQIRPPIRPLMSRSGAALGGSGRSLPCGGVEPTLGFEPRTCCLRNSCSTAELCRRGRASIEAAPGRRPRRSCAGRPASRTHRRSPGSRRTRRGQSRSRCRPAAARAVPGSC